MFSVSISSWLRRNLEIYFRKAPKFFPPRNIKAGGHLACGGEFQVSVQRWATYLWVPETQRPTVNPFSGWPEWREPEDLKGLLPFFPNYGAVRKKIPLSFVNSITGFNWSEAWMAQIIALISVGWSDSRVESFGELKQLSWIEGGGNQRSRKAEDERKRKGTGRRRGK